MLCCCRISLEHTTENMASLSGPFIKAVFAQNNKKRDALPESCSRLALSIATCANGETNFSLAKQF